jgi:hypothetical protein
MMMLLAVIYLLLFSPLLLLVFVWRGLMSGRKTWFVVVMAGLVSLCYGYLLSALLFKTVILGPDYSDRLFLTAQFNTGFALVLFVLAILRRSPERGLLACTALTVSTWFCVAINTSV